MASGLRPLRRTGRFLLSPRRSRLRPPSPRPHPPAESYCVRGKSSDCAPLSGLGVRVKRIAGVGVKVYACGLYVDVASALRALGSAFSGRDPRDVARDEALYAAVLCDPGVEKTVRLAFARDLDSSKIADALSERLRPVLGAGSESLRAFEAPFAGVTFRKGETLTFSAVAGELRTSIRGKEVGCVKDPELCVALFDAYLGKDPVVPGAKKSLGEKLAELATETR
jgi:hypothetical protein